MTTFSIYIIFLLTLLGTSAASGNVREEGKTFVIFTSALSTLISSMAWASSKRTGNVRQPVFSQANFAFAFKVYNCCAILSFKSVRVSLICLGLNLSGCCEMFSFWPNQLKKRCYLFGWFCLLGYLFLRIGSHSCARNRSYLRLQVPLFVSTKFKNTFQSI